MRDNKIIVANTTAAAAADLVVKDQYLFFKNEEIGRILDMNGRGSDIQAAAAEVPRQQTVTIAATVLNSTVANGEQKYSFKVTVSSTTNPGNVKTTTVTHVTPAVGAVTPTTVATAMVAWINAQAGIGFTATNAAGVITLVGVAGYGPINAIVVSQPTAITIAETVAYVAPVGLAAQCQAFCHTAAQIALLTATKYTIVTLECIERLAGGSVQPVEEVYKTYLFLDPAMTNYAALLARIVEVTKSFAASGSTVDPEIIALKS